MRFLRVKKELSGDRNCLPSPFTGGSPSLSCRPLGAFCILEAFLEQDPSGTLQPHLPGSHAARQRASSFVWGDKVPTCLSLFTKGRDVSRVRMGGWDHRCGGGHLSSIPGFQALSPPCCLPLISVSCQFGFLKCFK